MKKVGRFLLFVVGMAVIVIWTIIGLQYLYWHYIPIKIITVINEPCPVLNPGKRVKRGGHLEYTFQYEKDVEINGIVSRTLINDRLIPLSETECASIPVGKNSKIIRVHIPPNMFPGPYYLLNTIRYPINDDRNVVVNYRTEWFEVTE